MGMFGVDVGPGLNTKILIEQGWQATYRRCFGDVFVDGLAPHHIEAIEWHWTSRIDFLEGRLPKYDAYFPIWSRGHAKSGLARRLAIIEGLLSHAYGQPAYILYISRNKDMALKHSKSVETLLQSKRVREISSQLAQEQVNDQKRSKGWTAKFIYTGANVIYHFAGLEEGMAGGNLETNVAEEADDDRLSDVRVTQFILDDIDGREDSPTIAEGRFKTLTDEVLPMGQGNTLAFFAQNLISRHSTMYRIYKQQAKVLTGRKPTEPIPAVRDFKYEERVNDDGIIQNVFVSGEPTWAAWDAARVQQEINRFGIEAFKRECQHEVEQSKEGLIHQAYNDKAHPISYSQFAAVYGSPDAWKDWYKVPANDWARTKTKYHANVAAYMAVSSQNVSLPQYRGLTFVIPFSFPANTLPEDVAIRFLSELTPYAVRDEYRELTWKDVVDDAFERANAENHTDSLSERLTYLGKYYYNLVAKYSRPVLAAYKVAPGVNSHSEDKVREMLNMGFGFRFGPSNPGKTEAIEDVETAMKVIPDKDHLFRPGEKGYTRWYILCPDDKKGPMTLVNGHETYPPEPYPDEAMEPDKLHDSQLCRYQMCNRRYRDPVLTVTGEAIDELEKTNDDFGQLFQMVYLKRLLSNIPLTQGEQIVATMPPAIRTENIVNAEQRMGQMRYLAEKAAEIERKNQGTFGRFDEGGLM